MSGDVLAVASPLPPSTGATATSVAGPAVGDGAAPADGSRSAAKGFASIIAAAMEPAAGTETPSNGGPLSGPGIDLMAAALAGTPVPDLATPWLDRDAGAELAAEAAGAAMLAAMLSTPPQLIAVPDGAGQALPHAATPGAADASGMGTSAVLDRVESGMAADVITVPTSSVPVATGERDGASDAVAVVPVLVASAPALPAVAESALEELPPTAAAPTAVEVVAPPLAGVGAAVPTAIARVASPDDGRDPLPDEDGVDASSAVAGLSESGDAISDAAARSSLDDRRRDARDEGETLFTAHTEAATPQLAVPAVANAERPQDVAPAARTPGAVATLDAPDGPRLASNLAETVERATLNGDRDLTLALNPPDLGQLTVQVTEHASGAVSISIHASSGQAHDLLQQNLSALRAGLEQRDVRVEQLRVEQQSAAAGLSWQGSGQRQSRGEQGENEQPEWSPLASMQRVESVGGVRPAVRSERVGSVDVRA